MRQRKSVARFAFAGLLLVGSLEAVAAPACFSRARSIQEPGLRAWAGVSCPAFRSELKPQERRYAEFLDSVKRGHPSPKVLGRADFDRLRLVAGSAAERAGLKAWDWIDDLSRASESLPWSKARSSVQ